MYAWVHATHSEATVLYIHMYGKCSSSARQIYHFHFDECKTNKLLYSSTSCHSTAYNVAHEHSRHNELRAKRGSAAGLVIWLTASTGSYCRLWFNGQRLAQMSGLSFIPVRWVCKHVHMKLCMCVWLLYSLHIPRSKMKQYKVEDMQLRWLLISALIS